MNPGRRETLILVAAGLAAAAAGFLAGPLLLQPKPRGGVGEGTGSADLALASASLIDLAGQSRRLSDWQGRVLVCNFWATWCAPCREEIPLLMAARQKYGPKGVEIVGIAIDNAVKVREFSSTFNISYPILLAEAGGLDLMRQLGNAAGGLPYTVLADRQGKLVHRKLGAFRGADLDSILDPLVQG
jgi:thiol-disulfide isomerase/thioredoxin